VEWLPFYVLDEAYNHPSFELARDDFDVNLSLLLASLQKHSATLEHLKLVATNPEM
jgi:hypothetical protein